MKKYASFTEEEKEANRAYGRAYYERNREKVIARTAAYNKTEKAVARRRVYDMKPEQVAKRKARDDATGEAYRKEQWAKTKENPELLEKRYAQTREWRTGMSAEIYDALLVAQNNSCAICSREFLVTRKGDRKRRGQSFPCADHCHDGGGPRGLLCHACNTIEGLVKSTGLTAQQYLERLHGYLLDPPVSRLDHSGLCRD